MYLPIPEGVNHSVTVTASVPKTECETAKSTTRTATFTIAKSTSARVKQSNSALYECVRPTHGKWSEIKRSGDIKMTEMSIVNETTSYEIGRLNVPYIATKLAGAYNHKLKVNGVCTNCQITSVYDVKCAVAKGRYVEQGDLSYWKSKYPSAPHYALAKGILDSDQLEAAKSSVYAELFQAYNLGEEIAELRETIASVTSLTRRAVSLISDFKKVLGTNLLRVPKDQVKVAGDKWMEFRYGIMPIVYSIQDILKLRADSGLYRTTRATVYPVYPDEDTLDRPNIYFEEVGAHSLVAKVTAKARWQTNEMKTFDLININPLTTVSAVLPWTMVIRWFFNVQSYLDCRVKSLTSLALEHCACVAIREKNEYGTYLSAKIGYDLTIVKEGWNQICGPDFHGTRVFGPYTDFTRQSVLLARHTVNNYHRYLFQPSDVNLVFSPHLTWQRGIDAAVLAMRPLSKLLRRLK